MPPNRAPQTPAPPLKLLRCPLCGKVAECQPADLLQYIQTEWPRCCGEVMTLYVPTTLPEDLKVS
jgi:hypothetical protein